ncbi:MAG: sarcosine oxidase subunit delta [Pseudomonadota bacterium]
MMQIHCPFCGPRDQDEFVYVGNASVVYPPLDAPREVWCDAVFYHDNPRGWVHELWQHVHGCRSFLVIVRHTVTHEIASVRLAHPGEAAAMAATAPATDPAPDAAAAAPAAPTTAASATAEAAGEPPVRVEPAE